VSEQVKILRGCSKYQVRVITSGFGYRLPGVTTSTFGAPHPPTSDSASVGSFTTSYVDDRRWSGSSADVLELETADTPMPPGALYLETGPDPAG
jgi:hypothetical protein